MVWVTYCSVILDKFQISPTGFSLKIRKKCPYLATEMKEIHRFLTLLEWYGYKFYYMDKSY